MKKNRGFTITELLAVVVILGLIVAIAVPVYFNVSKSVRENEYKSKKSYIESIASRYAEENNATTAQVFSVGQLVASGYMSAEDYVDSDGTSIPYLANPTNSNDNLACHTVTITVENYDYNASMSDESNCEIVTSEVKASEMGIKAYKLYGDSVGSEINIIGQSIDWVNTDVLISVNPKYEWNSMSLSINGETKEVDKEKVCTSPVVSDCSNIIIVRAEVILKNTVAISVQTEDKVNATTIEVKIDKEAPTVTTEKNDAWVSENKQTIVYASDGSGSGAKSVYVTSTNVRPNVGTNSCTISNRCFSVSDEITGTILVEGLNNGIYYLWGMDKAGNLAMTSTVLTITNVDDSPAIGEMTVRSSKSEYNSKEVVVSLNASDSESGVVEACVTTEDSSANCNWQSYTSDIFTTNYQIATDEGSGNNYTIYGFIKDGVGHVTKLGSKPYSVYKACSIVKYVNGKEAYDSNLNTRCPEQDKVNEAYFNTGKQVNEIMKKLANGNGATYSTGDTLIQGFQKSDALQNNSVLLSSSNSPLPIYAWYKNNTIYWYTQAEDVYLNKDSNWMFYNFSGMKTLNLNDVDSSKVTSMYYMFGRMFELTSLDLGDKFDTSNVTSMTAMFDMDFLLKSKLTSLNLGDKFDTSKVTSMYSMFHGLNSLTSLDLGDKFDTSNVTSMGFMFVYMKSLTSLDLGDKFDTSKVTGMSGMFNGMSSLTSLDLGDKFDTSNVTDMTGGNGPIFEYCSSLTTLDLGDKFNTSKITNMDRLFQGMSSLTSLNLGKSFDTSNATSMKSMFSGLSSLTSLDLGDHFDTSKVTSMNSMFYGMKSLTSLDLGEHFNTSNVTSMSSMFNGVRSLSSLNIGSWNTSNVTTMEAMFASMNSLTTLDIGSWNTSSVTNMKEMFDNNGKLTTLNVNGLNTSNVTTMEGMFRNDKSLTNLDLSSFDTTNVTNMHDMFDGATAITSLDLSNFNTSKVTTMEGMFASMYELTSLNVSSFDTSNVTNMGAMFAKDSKLTTLDLSNFNTSSVTTMYGKGYFDPSSIYYTGMFGQMSNLTTIYVGNNFNVNNVSDSTKMFEQDYKLVGGSGTKYNSSRVDKTYARVDGGTSSPGYLTRK
ncbi:MAG: BspA family leucine-rich repeat surface protein [Bacilli bacterium]|nr:BspA family leucine-rich repeat surface protein [Bacilli bacterium]